MLGWFWWFHHWLPWSGAAQSQPFFQLNKPFLWHGCDIIFKENRVLNGRFKGMHYPQKASVGSELDPKLLGSYESELVAIIHLILTQNDTTIIDIGCAEGYYAKGIGMKNRTLESLHMIQTNSPYNFASKWQN
ncbi:MAG: hypothetical protein ACI8Z5_000575 [Lentimonas sp.]